MSESFEAVVRRAARYDRRALCYEKKVERLKRRIAWLAGARLCSFLCAAVCGFAAVYDQAPWPYGPIAALSAVLFAVAVILHRQPFERLPLVEALWAQNREASLRLQRAWGQLPQETAGESADAAVCRDLQLFGRGSIYQQIGRLHLPQGKARLRALLLEGLSPKEIPAHQAAAQALAERGGWRQKFEAEARRGQIDEAALAALLAFAETTKPLPWLKPVAILGKLLVALTLLFGILSAVGEAVWPWRWTLAAQAAVFLLTTGSLKKRYVPLLGREGRLPLTTLKRLFALCEQAHFEAEAISALQAQLKKTSPSVRLGKLGKTLEGLAVKSSPLTYLIANLALLFELHCSDRLERWRLVHGTRLSEELSLLGQMEVWGAIGGYAADHPEYAWPEVFWDGDFPERAPLSAQEIGHPLFDPAKRQVNDFMIAKAGQVTLITGSNMSGKSSFLRTLGLNAVMAMAGCPVCARRLSLAACECSTCIQVTDSPEEGLSRFYAEVLRMKGVLDEIDQAEQDQARRPRLFLVDEMLSGTNSRERNLASDAIVKRLCSARRSFGLVTTHDLALAHLCDGEQVLCKHFSDQFDGEKLHFDYQLKEGVAKTTNALQVLRLAGIDVPLEYERSGELA